MRFEIDIDNIIGREQREYFGSKLSTATDAKNILHQSIPLLNYNKLSGMHSQNQFITPQQQQREYLNQLLQVKRKKTHREMAYTCAQSIVNKLAERLEEGVFQIDDNPNDAKDLLIERKLTDKEKRLLNNRIRNEEKSRRNRLLYPRNRSKSEVPEEQYPSSILSPERHKQLITSIKAFKIKKEQIMKKSRQKQVQQQKSIEEIEKEQQGQRINEIEKKKEKIQENLKKMRENHQEFIRQEQQSKQIINQIRNKKKLYQHLKQSYEQKILIPLQEQNKKRLEQLKQKSRLNLQQIQNHEKQYIERKKSQQKQSMFQRSKVSNNQYKPPEHTQKIKKILAEEEKQKHKQQMQRKLILQKIQRVSNYTDQIRKINPLPSRTITTQRQPSQQMSELQGKDKKQLGNQYLQQARRQLRKRAKTQQGQKNFIKEQKKQQKIIVSKTVELGIRQKRIQKSKKEQIERILSFGDCSPQQKIKRIRTADQKLSVELKKKENILRKLPVNKRQGQSVLDLMLGAIKAKLNLLNFYQTVQ